MFAIGEPIEGIAVGGVGTNAGNGANGAGGGVEKQDLDAIGVIGEESGGFAVGAPLWGADLGAGWDGEGGLGEGGEIDELGFGEGEAAAGAVVAGVDAKAGEAEHGLGEFGDGGIAVRLEEQEMGFGWVDVGHRGSGGVENFENGFGRLLVCRLGTSNSGASEEEQRPGHLYRMTLTKWPMGEGAWDAGSKAHLRAAVSGNAGRIDVIP